MHMKPITPRGKIILEKKIKAISEHQSDLVIQMASARDQGDLSENAAYQALCEELKLLQSDLLFLQETLRSSIVVSKGFDRDEVQFGATVTLEELDNNNEKKSYTLVDEFCLEELNNITSSSEKQPRFINVESPIGQKLLGTKINKIIHLPKGYMKITNIYYNFLPE